MTRKQSARLAGFFFLFYIATGITSLVLFNRAAGGAEETAAKLASLAQHAMTVRLTALLNLLTFVDAVALAVALYALTRDQDPDLAVLALCCRAAEGMIGAISAISTLGLLSVATASTAGTDAAAATALGALLLKEGGAGSLVAATCFALGSTLYCWLFLRARSIPVPLAKLGVFSSVLLVIAVPLQMAAVLRGMVTYLVWIPMTVFEVTLAVWLLIKGVAMPPARQWPAADAAHGAAG